MRTVHLHLRFRRQLAPFGVQVLEEFLPVPGTDRLRCLAGKYARPKMWAVPATMPIILKPLLTKNMKNMEPVSCKNAEHYLWGDVCHGWHLLKSSGMSVIQEMVSAKGELDLRLISVWFPILGISQ